MSYSVKSRPTASCHVLQRLLKQDTQDAQITQDSQDAQDTKQRRSILVRSAVYQEGPKNPLKGISLKSLVSALNAQFGVGAGGKRGKGTMLRPCLRSQGALQRHGGFDPVSAETCYCAGQFGTV